LTTNTLENTIQHSSQQNNHESILNIDSQCLFTEDWSNVAENTALITGINYSLLYIPIESSYFKL